MAAADLRKRYQELEKLVRNVDFTLGNNNELLEMQTDLVSELQQVLYEKQLNLDELRHLRDHTQTITTLLVEKVKKERKQKKDQEERDKETKKAKK
jgi:hypothetical protein